jgi:hypothetical protein
MRSAGVRVTKRIKKADEEGASNECWQEGTKEQHLFSNKTSISLLSLPPPTMLRLQPSVIGVTKAEVNEFIDRYSNRPKSVVPLVLPRYTLTTPWQYYGHATLHRGAERSRDESILGSLLLSLSLSFLSQS